MQYLNLININYLHYIKKEFNLFKKTVDNDFRMLIIGVMESSNERKAVTLAQAVGNIKPGDWNRDDSIKTSQCAFVLAMVVSGNKEVGISDYQNRTMTVPAVGMGAVDRTILWIGWQGETGYSQQRECTS